MEPADPPDDTFELTPRELEIFLKFQDPDYEPTGIEIPVDEFLLEVAVSERQPAPNIHQAVLKARAAGTPWARIARILGVSVNTARRRHGSRSARAPQTAHVPPCTRSTATGDR